MCQQWFRHKDKKGRGGGEGEVELELRSWHPQLINLRSASLLHTRRKSISKYLFNIPYIFGIESKLR